MDRLRTKLLQTQETRTLLPSYKTYVMSTNLAAFRASPDSDKSILSSEKPKTDIPSANEYSNEYPPAELYKCYFVINKRPQIENFHSSLHCADRQPHFESDCKGPIQSFRLSLTRETSVPVEPLGSPTKPYIGVAPNGINKTTPDLVDVVIHNPN